MRLALEATTLSGSLRKLSCVGGVARYDVEIAGTAPSTWQTSVRVATAAGATLRESFSLGTTGRRSTEPSARSSLTVPSFAHVRRYSS